MFRSRVSRCALTATLLTAVSLARGAEPPNHGPAPMIPVPGIEIPQMDGLPEDVQKLLKQMFGPAQPAAVKWGGAKLKRPMKALLEQLNLPQGQGLVVSAVEGDSPEAKAGLKENDLLLKINNMAVPGDPAAFTKFAEGLKVGAAVQVTVLRKGKEHTLRDVKMAAVSPEQANPFAGFGGILGGVQVIQKGPGNKLRAESNLNGAKIVRTHDGDDFTGEYVKDKVTIRVTGKFINEKLAPGLITVQEDKEIRNYQTVDQVPERFRGQVRDLFRPVELNGIPGLPMVPGLPGGQECPE